MPSSKITLTNNNQSLTVNQVVNLRISFETVDFFSVTDYFEIEFPSDLASSLTFNPASLSGGLTLVRASASYSANVLRLYLNTGGVSVRTINSPFSMHIVVGTFVAPPST